MDHELGIGSVSTRHIRTHFAGTRTSISIIVFAVSMALCACSSNDAPNVATVIASESPTARALAADRSESDALRDAERTALKLANAAYQADRIIAPAGNNALEFALSARNINADSAGAAEMLTDIAPTISAQVQMLINGGNLAEADRVLALLHQANPDSLTTLSLQRQRDRAARPLAMGSVASVAR